MPITSEELSEREREILTLVATGASNKEIAQQLSISANTVKVHLRNIFAKIGASSRTEAAMYAVRIGLAQQVVVLEEPSSDAVLPSEANLPAVALEPVPDTAPILQAPPVGAEPETARRPARLWLAVLAVGLLLALAGGWLVWQLSGAGRLGSLAAYDAARWQTLAPLPAPRSGFAAAVFQGSLCVFGGEESSGLAAGVACYDLQANRWQSRASLPAPVRDVSAAVVGGKIYLPGGQIASGQLTDVLQIYDPYRDAWSQGAPLPAALSGYALAEDEGRLYLFGGWDGSRAVDSLYVYEPAVDRWTVEPAMPVRRAFAAAAVSAGRIYLMGGLDGERALSSVQIYQPGPLGQNDEGWQNGPALPDGRYRMGAATIADIIFLAGGTDGHSDTRLALQLLPQAEHWEGFELPVQKDWIDLGLAPVGTKLLMLGGVLDGQRIDRQTSYQAIFTISLPVIR